MTEKSIFSGPVLAMLIAGTTAVFALSILLMMTGSSEDTAHGSNTKSISAIGQAGLYELAQRYDIPVIQSRLNGIETPGDGGLLVMAEPDSGLSTQDIIRLGRASNVLLVLPKRWGWEDPNKPGWVASTYTLDASYAGNIASLVETDATVVRGDPPANWAHNQIGIDPSFDDGAQLIVSRALKPIIGDAKGMLIGEKQDGNQRIWVLSDPDIIENHGLAKGENAAFTLAVLNALRDDEGRVVFDETIHGMVNIVDSPFRRLFQFPYVILVFLGVAAVAILMWATTSRFGKPRVAPPAFDFGKGRLIANTASLLDRAGHQAFVMRRYVQMTLRDTGRLFHAPRQLDDEQLANWLDVIGKARGVDTQACEILARTMPVAASNSLTGLFQATQDIHHWKTSIIGRK